MYLGLTPAVGMAATVAFIGWDIQTDIRIHKFVKYKPSRVDSSTKYAILESLYFNVTKI